MKLTNDQRQILEKMARGWIMKQWGKKPPLLLRPFNIECDDELKMVVIPLSILTTLLNKDALMKRRSFHAYSIKDSSVTVYELTAAGQKAVQGKAVGVSNA